MRAIRRNQETPVPARYRSFISRCRARGVRITCQRLAVFEALAEDRNHPSAEAVYAKVRKTMPSLSLSTVYRILESLQSKGLIRRVSAQDDAARFDAKLEPHQHLNCRICGRMIDFEEASLSRLRLPDARSAGFVPERLDIRVVGTCRACRRSQPNATHYPKEES